MVAMIERAARYIGLTIDNALEFMVFLAVRTEAAANACDLSAYAREVFHVVCSMP
jgi:hypothetical protein